MPIPTPLNGLRASLNPILAAISVQLQKVLKIPAGRIKEVVRAQVPKFDGDSDVLLWPRGFRGDPEHRDRHDRRIFRTLDVVLRTRLELDEVDQDALWLTDPVLGIVVSEESIMVALQDFTPTNPITGVDLVFQALDVTNGQGYERRPEDLGWGQVTLNVEIAIELPLTQNLFPL